MLYPRVLVITSCTGEKRFKPDNQLTLKDFQDATRLKQREAELQEYACPAGDIYTGMQHLRLMEGVRLLRGALGKGSLDVKILSAGYGLIPENRVIVPYEVTFNNMKAVEFDAWTDYLDLHQAISSAIASYDLIFFLLGDNYLRAASLPLLSRSDQAFVFLASRSQASAVQGMEARTGVVLLSNLEAKKYSYGLVGLKGYLFKQFAQAVELQPNLFKDIYEHPELFQTVIDERVSDKETQLALVEVLQQVPTKSPKSKKISHKPKKFAQQDGLLAIPDVMPAPNRHLGMQYFIPEWDDRVYPRYDFLADQLPAERDPYQDDVYAHEIYSTSNYDGILISKIVIDESPTRRGRVEAVGVHDYVRFKGKIMGDCGAFGYVKEEEPPYETDEILDYYDRLGFDYGVSIDHLIFGPFAEPGVREKRYELTLRNAEAFLKRHRSLGYQFEPIGVAQGWSPATYAESVKELIRIGYDFIALGGMARAQNREIIPVLKAIYPHIEPHVRIHLFGVARIEAIPIFRHLGVTSFDSAGPLRQAWLSSDKNYHTLSGKQYMAIRVPPLTGKRAKDAIKEGKYEIGALERLEQDALKALREFDKGKVNLEVALNTVATYNEALDLPKKGESPDKIAKLAEKRRQKYFEMLVDQPWKKCDCKICREVGIEVAIFRNNNRNRRRGFHNTYVFYERLKNSLES